MRTDSPRLAAPTVSRSLLRRAAVLTAAMAVGVTLATAASAGNLAARVPVSGGQRVAVTRLPLAASGAQRVTVVVTLAADSVATARARASTHRISDAETQSITRAAAAQHAALRPSIESRGGRVLASYQHALNGLKVEIDSRELAGLAALPGVASVLRVPTYKMSNVVSVPYLGAPAVWAGEHGLRGEHIKIAVIDSGIDYTHADFGGPGTPAAYQAAAAASAAPADPRWFGPNAPKVKGGIDLAGDAYDGYNSPQPDANPLDCGAHGTHVAGTAAGFGVAADGSTYRGPYSNSTYQRAFLVGPGVAPKADLYAVRVFGCHGVTSLVTDALDWAVKNDMDVVNMSLGAPFGPPDSSDSLAADNAARAGITVVAAAGNDGPAPYIVSSPGSSALTLSVAAIDVTTPTLPGYAVALSTGGSIEALDANGGAALPATGIVVLRNPDGSVSLGCNAAEYAGTAGKLVVTARGTCDRIARAINGQAAGAAAVAMINNGPGYPPVEGAIPGVTIPFVGILASDGPALVAAAAAALTPNTTSNPLYETAASFSSGGPRFGDSLFKPNVSAPGVLIKSAYLGTGTQAAAFSGTSMATPHVAGVAALTRQAHPTWSERQLAAAIIETSSPGTLADYTPRLEGAGVVQPLGAARTQAVALTADGATALSFGLAELSRDFNDSRTITVQNLGRQTLRFSVSSTPAAGSAHTVSFNRTSLSLGAGESADLRVTLKVPAAGVGPAPGFQQVAGFVTLAPERGSNAGVSLTLPYYLVPRARAAVGASLSDDLSSRHPNGSVQLRNSNGITAGNADFYAWGLSSPPQGLAYVDTRAVGVQSNIISSDNSVLVFAINTYTRFSNAAGSGEWDILIDTNGDGAPDFVLFAVDEGLATSGSFNGVLATFLYDFNSGNFLEYPAEAGTDGSTILMPVLASDLGLSPSQPRFSYVEATYNLQDGSSSQMPGAASFNAFTPSISNALWVPVGPGVRGSLPVSINPSEWAVTPALGLMVVVEDNASGTPQAQLLRVRR